MSTPNAFSVAQPIYAALGIATFPVAMRSDGQKVPEVKYWQRVGLPGSAKLAEKFTHSQMLGFCPGERSNVTVLDIDTDDKRVLADALSRHGKSPLVVRTASGKFHAYYRYDGEERLIRPWKDQPIDVLGGGLVVAPPSVAPNRKRYEIIAGKLDDILNLPPMRGLGDLKKAEEYVVRRTIDGERNNNLFRSCLRAAKKAASEDELHAMALAENATYLPPLEEDQVRKVVASAWLYEAEGRNWVGGPGMVALSVDTIDRLAPTAPDAFALLAVLKRFHQEKPRFFLANSTASKFGWGKNRFRRARKHLVESGDIRCLNPGGRWDHDAPIYTWH